MLFRTLGYALHRSNSGTTGNLDGCLITVVGRVCLDVLRSRKARREESLDVPAGTYREVYLTHHEMGLAPQLVDTALPFPNGQGRGKSSNEQVSAKQQSKKIVGITPPTGRPDVKNDSSLVPDTSVRQRSRRARRTEASSLRPIVIL